MPRMLLLLLVLLPLLGMAQFELPARPAQYQPVNDYTQTLSADEQQRLDSLLRNFEHRSSTQISMVLVESLQGTSIKEAAIELARSWGIGQSEFDNGILIFAALRDKKVRIEVGYGLEAAVPDMAANNIIQEDILPNFKEKAYFKGLWAASHQLIELSQQERFEPPLFRRLWKQYKQTGIVAFFGFVLALLFIYPNSDNKRYVPAYFRLLHLSLLLLINILFVLSFNSIEPAFSTLAYLGILLGYYYFYTWHFSQLSTKPLKEYAERLFFRLKEIPEKSIFHKKKWIAQLVQLKKQLTLARRKSAAKECLEQIETYLAHPLCHFDIDPDKLSKALSMHTSRLKGSLTKAQYQAIEDYIEQKQQQIGQAAPLSDKVQAQILSKLTVYEHIKERLIYHEKIRAYLWDEGATPHKQLLLQMYQPKEQIHQKLAALQQRFKAEDLWLQPEGLTLLYEAVKQVFEQPEQYFQRRADADLQYLALLPQLKRNLKNPAFTANSRKQCQKYLVQELHFFEQLDPSEWEKEVPLFTQNKHWLEVPEIESWTATERLHFAVEQLRPLSKRLDKDGALPGLEWDYDYLQKKTQAFTKEEAWRAFEKRHGSKLMQRAYGAYLIFYLDYQKEKQPEDLIRLYRHNIFLLEEHPKVLARKWVSSGNRGSSFSRKRSS